MSVLVLSLNEVKQCINMHQAIMIMESSFKEYHEQKAVLPLRTPIQIEKEDALMLTMPAYLSHQNALGIKVVSVFPNNAAKNKPAINGVMLVIDEQTGEAQAIMEAAYLTALRTGAVSGLATKYLANEQAKTVTIIGSGVQALTQLEAVAAVRSIEKVSVWSRNMDNSKTFAKKLSDTYEVQCHEHIKDAVKNADIICTATSSTEPLIHLSDLKEQVHINAVGSHTLLMREISNEVLGNAMVVVDQVEAALSESGEIVSAINAKSINKEHLIELGSVVCAKDSLKNSPISVFKSVGLAIQDISIAHAVYINALKMNLGTSVSLI